MQYLYLKLVISAKMYKYFDFASNALINKFIASDGS